MKRISIFILMFVLLVLSCLSCSYKQAALHSTNDDTPQIIASGECGEDIYWELDEFGSLSISGVGSMFNYEIETAPWHLWCTDITNIIVTEYSPQKIPPIHGRIPVVHGSVPGVETAQIPNKSTQGYRFVV